MRAFLSVLIIFLASQAPAQDAAVTGRMICEVTQSRFVAAGNGPSISNIKYGEEFSSGATFVFEYTLDAASGLSIYLGETDSRKLLIAEPFTADRFQGVSRVTDVAEFRASYSEVSFGKYRINYKGSDQLYLTKCRGGDWIGHYVQTNISGLFTQVASLNCRSYPDAVDEILARLTVFR